MSKISFTSKESDLSSSVDLSSVRSCSISDESPPTMGSHHFKPMSTYPTTKSQSSGAVGASISSDGKWNFLVGDSISSEGKWHCQTI